MPEGRCPRGVTPRPRSGAAAESTRLQGRRSCREELPHDRGRVEGGVAHRRYLASEVRGGDERSYPASEVRGGNERSYPASEVRGGNEKSYPASEVRGGRREEIPYAPRPRPGAGAGRSYPTPEAKGGSREEQHYT